ncbi:glycine cleavage system protein T [Acetobacter estunensis NRIC 0472]|uniref:aminomethyltransferase n=1 Tax=Acetobacter estunensis TaxID=104097 RepID=A0A967EC57_9PROT|nr:glycine cleavage system aminomethyltransferase GcvT [Acetobacter estunensis]NHO52911.1 glycine cleavage system aminomethyltransferase GcvT [Acetobacter estunensis]GBQ23338.1 glycine cleavage system protein T [Acetobacter estunensis NRIC 0472]
MSETLHHTPLFSLHETLGARMVPFAGYAMPLQYADGIMAEHLHTRAHAGLFDVSHMGQVIVRPRDGDMASAARALERIVPVDVLGLKRGRQRYGFLTNAQGGILDDLMIANLGDRFLVVVNAACKAQDIALMEKALVPDCAVDVLTDRGLLALQGPEAEKVLARLLPVVATMKFMDVRNETLEGVDVIVARSGYTGEDGFEISVPALAADHIARLLLAEPEVKPVGLGARDSLRLEAGLCLYGADLDTTTTPVEGALEWAIQKARRHGGAREGGFPGAEVVLRQLEEGAGRRRVGLLAEGRAPIRHGAALFAAAEDGEPVGLVTSGAFGPSLKAPVAMGYVPTALAAPGTQLFAELRGRRVPVKVAAMPFVPAGFKR